MKPRPCKALILHSLLLDPGVLRRQFAQDAPVLLLPSVADGGQHVIANEAGHRQGSIDAFRRGTSPPHGSLASVHSAEKSAPGWRTAPDLAVRYLAARAL